MYDLPDATTLTNDLRRVPLLVSTAERIDETASLAQFVCPDHHYLESWHDAEPAAGIVSLTQPAIQPLNDTRALTESLSAWGTEPEPAQPALDLLRAHWERAVHPRAGGSDPFPAFWNTTLERGRGGGRAASEHDEAVRRQQRARDSSAATSCLRVRSRWCSIRRLGCSTAGMATMPGSTNCRIR